MKHFISLRDFSYEELTALLERADYLRTAWADNSMPQSLKNSRVGLWFYGNGFRNRVAFELGAKAMGASVSFIPGELGVNEPLADIAGYLENWFSLVVLRTKRHADLLHFASLSHIPVINARTDKSHPCEVMGDLQYIRHHRGELKELQVVFVGEASNLCLTWLEAATVFPIKVTQVCPEGYEVDKETLRNLKKNARGEIAVTNDLYAALKPVDLIYTDCWPHTADDTIKKKIESDFLPYQIRKEHLLSLGEKGVFLPCPPVTRGQEVSFEVMNSPLCKNFAAKDNLLHIQNAIMELMATTI
jgi:ornithine carbamoyltransferase